MANLEIKLSANKRQPYLRHRVVGRVGEGGLTTINVQLLEEDEITPFVINLNGTLKFVGEVSNGNYTEGEPEIIDSTNGLISYTFTKSNFSTSHQFKQAYFEYVDPNGKKVTFQNFIIDVLERVDINSEQAKYYISSLEKLQSEMQTTFNQFISDKQVQYDQIYSKYNELVRLINESDKQANDLIDQTNQQIGELRNDLKLSEAWAWSADGTDRFTTVYPGENYVRNSQMELEVIDFNENEATKALGTPFKINELIGKTVIISAYIEITNIRARASGTNRMGAEIRLLRSNGSYTFIGVWEYLSNKVGQSIARKRISSKVSFPADVVPNSDGNLKLMIQSNCDYAKISEVKLEPVEATATVPTIYTPAPSEDYANAYPQYRGLALLPSDLPDDYSWDVTPEYTEKGLNDTVSLTEPQSIEGLKNFEDGIQSKGKSVLTSDDNKYEVVTLTVTNGNTGSAKLYREGKTVSIYFVALNGKSSGGNDSTILTIPEGYRPPISFEQLVGSIDRSTLNSAQLSIDADGAIKWRRNSSYGSDYTFAITYTI